MSSTATPTTAPTGKKQALPSLAGVKTKQRKGVAKASAKHEPAVFRDTLCKHLEAVPAGDFDGYAKKLDDLGSVLDYRKYEQEFFQLLLVGRLLAPGGGFLQDGSSASPFSVIGSAKEPAELGNIKTIAEVFNKLIRRYKYLQKDFEETSLPAVLQHVNKFDNVGNPGSGANTPVIASAALPNLAVAAGTAASAPPSRSGTPQPGVALPGPRPNQDKLAMITAVFVTTGVAAPTVLASIKKDHLVKDGTTLAFLTVYLKTYLTNESIDHLFSSLRRGGCHDLMEFLPASRRSMPELAAAFKKVGLDAITDMFQKQRANEVIKVTSAHLREMIAGSDSNEEIISYLKDQDRSKAIPDVDFVTLIWSGLVSNLDLNENPAGAGDELIKELKETAAILEPFCQSGRTQVALINAIQSWCYKNTTVTGLFVKILLNLFNLDVLSSDAIIYWHSKGSRPDGRQQFLKQADPLVKKLEEQEEESDEE